MNTSFEERFITDFCNKIKCEGASKRSIAEQVFEAGYRLEASKEPLTGTGVDGWIDWPGGECPVDGDSLVQVKYRNGFVNHAEPAKFYIWTNGYGSCSTTDADIIAYRLHQPQEAEQAEADDEADLNDCIGQTQSNDQERDEILYELANFAASTCTSLDIGAATQIAIWLSDKGYRKQ